MPKPPVGSGTASLLALTNSHAVVSVRGRQALAACAASTAPKHFPPSPPRTVSSDSVLDMRERRPLDLSCATIRNRPDGTIGGARVPLARAAVVTTKAPTASLRVGAQGVLKWTGGLRGATPAVQVTTRESR
jgi:hypothetical protein